MCRRLAGEILLHPGQAWFTIMVLVGLYYGFFADF